MAGLWSRLGTGVRLGIPAAARAAEAWTRGRARGAGVPDPLLLLRERRGRVDLCLCPMPGQRGE